jgi:hypothetical protein
VFTRGCLSLTVSAEPYEHDSDSAGVLVAALVAAVSLDPGLLAPMRRAYDRSQERLEHDGLDVASATTVRLASTDGGSPTSYGTLHVCPLGTSSTVADARRLECVTVRGTSGWPHERRPGVATGCLSDYKAKPRSRAVPFAPRTSVGARTVTAQAATPRAGEETVLRLKNTIPPKMTSTPKIAPKRPGATTQPRT